jgi:hypothetical protein
VQHPHGRYQEWSFITEAERNGNGTRILYAGGTERGSSGSPIVDLNGRLVAIHHYFEQSRNQGVPVAKIFPELIAKGYTSARPPAGAAPVAAAVVSIDPFNARDLQGSAFVNRGILRGHLKGMAEKPREGRPTLVITGNSGTGVSYSYWLASHVAATATLYQPLVDAARGGMKVFAIDLRKYANASVEERREEIIDELLVGFEILTAEQLLEARDRHAQPVRSLTTVERTIKAKVMGSDRQWWVFLDNIDNAVATQQGDVRELIGTVIGIARDPQYRLRVVLAGREAHLVERGGAPANEDEVGGLPRVEVDRWLREEIDAAKCDVDETRLAEKLDALYPNGQEATASAIGPELPIILEQLITAAPNGN